jgi:hypothetical protein
MMARPNPQYPQTLPSTYTPAPRPTPLPQPAEPLEQRVLDLLYPYRDECFVEEEDDASVEAHERKALMLSSTYLALYLQATVFHQMC